MKTWTYAVTISVMMGCVIGWATDASARDKDKDKGFFCKATVASTGDPSPKSLSGPFVYDLGKVGSCSTYDWSINFNKKCEGPANSACSTKALGDNKFNSAAFWCALGVPNGSTIRAYVKVSTGKYGTAQTKGVLTNIAAVTRTTYDCEGIGGWLDKPSAGNGGQGRCVTNSCNAVSGVPIAPAWTSLGTSWSAPGPAWLTDANGNIWYGVPAHATTTVVSPAECRWQ